jgi:hypothetical protein
VPSFEDHVNPDFESYLSRKPLPQKTIKKGSSQFTYKMVKADSKLVR